VALLFINDATRHASFHPPQVDGAVLPKEARIAAAAR
jgi:hypothetical protein